MRALPLVAACLVAWPVAAAAQLRPAPDTGQTPGWTLSPAFAVSTAWDDNVILAGEGAETSSDTVTALTPSIDAQYLARHHWLALGYTGSFSVYRQLDQLNSFDQQLRVDTRHTLSKRVTVLLHDGFAKVPTTEAVFLSGIPFLRTGSRLNDFGARVQVALDGRTSLDAGYSFDWVAFDKDSPFVRFLRGGTAHLFEGGVRRQLQRRLWLGAHASFQRAIVADGGDQFDIFDASGQMSYQATPTLELSAGFGFSRLNDTTRRQAEVGPAWNISATWRLERATAAVAYVRSFVPSFGLGGTLQNEELNANLHMPVARNRLYWQAGLSWRRNEPLTPGEVDLKSLWLQTSVGYRLQRWVRIEGYYWRHQQDSQLAGGQMHRNRLGIQAVTSMPMRIK